MLLMGKILSLAILRRQTATTTLLALLLSVGCSRSVTPPGEDDPASAGDTAQDQRPLPFHGDTNDQAASPNSSGWESGSDSNRSGVPFASSGTGRLAAGTLLTVRLTDSLSATNSSSGVAFTASLDNRVVADGSAVLVRGTLVRGRVEASQAPEIKGDRGYVRVTLISMHVDGREVPLQTSSLFARGQAEVPQAAGKAALLPVRSATAGARGVSIEKGRLLTFRLASAVSFPLSDPAQLSKNSLSSGK